MYVKFAGKSIQRLAVAVLALVCGPAAHALGLGSAAVESYLGQPLQARIPLIGAADGELATITAGMASVADIEMMGISRTVSVPLQFDVNDDPAEPHVLVTSRLPVFDPVVQLVVEVRWSGGRMLREYTLFLDPPTLPSAAPGPRVFRAPPRQTEAADPSGFSVAEGSPGRDAASATPGAPVRGEIRPADEIADSAPRLEASPKPEPARREPRETVTVPAEPAAPATVAETGSGEIAAPAPESTAAATAGERPAAAGPVPAAEGETWGPVRRGETLWSIASRYVDGSEYSVNQAMLAIQRLNPDAFGGQNINTLHRGAILKMPSGAEIGSLSRHDALLEAMRQRQVYLAARAAPAGENLPTVRDVSFAEVDAEPAAPVSREGAEPAEEEALLQLVPPSGDGLDRGEAAGAAAAATGAISPDEVEETLARTEEELANAQQENAYLSERIRELESQLETAQAAGAVADNQLAELEQDLREERLSEDEGATEEPESRRSAWWLLLLLAVVVAGAVWLLRRMGSGLPHDGRDTGGPQEESGSGKSAQAEPPDDRVTPVDPQPPQSPAALRTPQALPNEEEAVELDSEDPEVKLDLARAYISMGDPRAARALLEEVIEIGNEEQAAEARAMMRET